MSLITTINREYLYKIMLSFRRHIPKSNGFYILFFLVKYFSIILFTHSILPNQDNNQSLFTLTKIIKFFIIFRNGPKKFPYKNICILIYILLLLFLSCFSFLIVSYYIKSKKTDQKLYDIPKNSLRLSPFVKIVQNFTTGLYIFIIFFYQHLVEFLYYGIFLAYYKNSGERHSNRDSPLIIYNNDMIIMGINAFLILVLMTLLYAFLLYGSTQGFECNLGFQMSNSHTEIVIKVILFSLQGIYSTSYYYSMKYQKDFLLFCSYFIFFLLIMDFLINLKQINYTSTSVIPFFIRFLSNFCLISSVVELVIYYLVESKTKTDQGYYLFLLVIEAINSIIITWFVSTCQEKSMLRKLAKNIFLANKACRIELLYEFYLILMKKKTIKEKYLYFLKLIHLHQTECALETCDCRKLEECYLTPDGMNKLEQFINKFANICEKKISLVIMGENSINPANLKKFLYFHCDFLLNVQKKITITFYLSQYYLLKKTNELNYSFAYKIYEINWSIKNNKKINEVYDDSKKDEISFFEETLQFEKIKKIISGLCANFEKLLHFKSIKNSSAKLLFNSEHILNPLINFMKQKDLLLSIIEKKKNSKSFKHSAEIQYLILYFLKLFQLKISSKVNLYKDDIEYPTYGEIYEATFENSKKKSHHIILFLNSDNKFIIRNISTEICEIIQYPRVDLIENDFNEVLMPRMISQFHSIYMKQFILLGSTSYVKNTYLINKEMKLFPIKATIKVLPTASSLFALIVNCEFLRSNNFNQYFVMCDINYRILCLSDSFENQFVMSMKMLNSLKMSICDFFGVNKDKISSYYRNIVSEKFKNTKGGKERAKIFAVTSIKNEERYFYQNIPAITIKKKYEAEEVRPIDDFYQENELVKFETVSKDSILSSIVNIAKSIGELGLEKEWKSKLTDLYNKFKICLGGNSLDDSVLSITKKRSFSQKKANNSRNENNENGEFILKFHYKIIGTVHYYMIVISELKEAPGKQKKQVVFSSEGPEKNENLLSVGKMGFQYKRSVFDSKRSIFASMKLDSDNSFYDGEGSRNLNSSNLNVLGNQNTSSSLKIQTSIFGVNTTDALKDSSQADFLPQSLSKLNKKPSQKKTLSSITQQAMIEFSYCSLIGKWIPYLKLFQAFFFFILLLLNVINLISNSKLKKSSLTIFYVNTYSFLVVNDIFYGALSCVTLCLAEDKIQNSLDRKTLEEKIDKSAEYLINHYHLFQTYLNKIDDKNKMESIYSIINQDIIFYQMVPNWKIQEKISTLIEEIYFIHYSLRTFTSQNHDGMQNFCRMQEFFFSKKFQQIAGTTTNYSTVEERFFYYIAKNILTSVSSILTDLIKETEQTLTTDSENSNKSITLVNSAIIMAAIVLYGFVLATILISRMIFKSKLKFLFIQHEHEIIFFDDIKRFHQLVDVFSINSSDEYTFYKRGLLTTEENYEKDMLFMGKQIPTIHINKPKSRKSQFVHGQGKNKIKQKGQKNSVTKVPSSYQNSLQYSNKQSESDENKDELREKQFDSRIEPKYLIFSIIVICIVFIIFLGVEIANLIVNKNSFNGLNLENKFATNFLQRCPKLYEMTLYSILSAAAGDENYITVDYSNYEGDILSNYYQIKQNVESDSIYAKLGNSKFSYLYYQVNILRENINYFINDKKMYYYLLSTTEAEFKFRDDEWFCIYSNFVYLKKENDNMTIKNFYQIFSEYTRRCKNVGNKINLSGYKVIMDLMIQQMTNYYFNFADDKTPERQLNFLKEKGIATIEENLLNVMQILHFADAYLIIDDIESTYHKGYKIKTIFSISSIILSNIGIFFVVLGISSKLNLYNKVIGEIVKIFEKSVKKYSYN